jgi:signal peptidase I
MKMPRKTITITLIVIIQIALLGILGFMGWCHWKNTSTPILLVTTNSMTPYIPKNSLVFINNRWGDDLHQLIGKAIAFHNPLKKKIIVHRVLAVEGDLVSTKGDYNFHIDTYQPSREDIIGYVEHSIEYYYILVTGLILIIALLSIVLKVLPDSGPSAS